MNQFRTFWRDESGATAIEYALIASLIFLAIVASVQAFTSNAQNMYGKIANNMINS